MTESYGYAATGSGAKKFTAADMRCTIGDMQILMTKPPSFNYASMIVESELYEKMVREVEAKIVAEMRVPYSLYGMPVYTVPRSILAPVCDAPPVKPAPYVPRPEPFVATVHGWQIGVLFAVGVVILSLLFSVV